MEAFNFALGALEKAGEARKTLILFKEMKSGGVVPTMTTFAIVVRALQAANMLKEALEIYNSMPMKKVVGSSLGDQDTLRNQSEAKFHFRTLSH